MGPQHIKVHIKTDNYISLQLIKQTTEHKNFLGLKLCFELRKYQNIYNVFVL